jgi:LysM repeat protein
MGVANWRDPNPPRRPDPVLVWPAAAKPAPEFNAAKDSQAANVAAPQTGAAANMAKDPAQRAQALAAPATVVKPAPVVKTEPAPVVKAAPAPTPVAAPAVDTTGGAGKTGPTIAASKGLDSSNQLNKGPVILPTPAPAPAPTGDWKALAKANKITDPNIITPGQELKLPGDIKYTVSKGDTLSGIASGNYKGTAPITPAPSPPPEITTDRLKALSGNATSLPSTLGPSPTIDLLNKGVNGKTSSADLVPDIKTAAADTDADDLEKMAVAENSKPINTQRYSFLLGL